MTMNNWIYSEDRMALRAEVLGILLKEYGTVQLQTVSYSTEDIYSAAHDWVSHGNPTSEGILDYFSQRFLNT